MHMCLEYMLFGNIGALASYTGKLMTCFIRWLVRELGKFLHTCCTTAPSNVTMRQALRQLVPLRQPLRQPLYTMRDSRQCNRHSDESDGTAAYCQDLEQLHKPDARHSDAGQRHRTSGDD
jgi:hypothetical protein